MFEIERFGLLNNGTKWRAALSELRRCPQGGKIDPHPWISAVNGTTVLRLIVRLMQKSKVLHQRSGAKQLVG